MSIKKLKCDICNNKFSTKPNLLAHQRKAKYCLKLRANEKQVKLNCEGCSNKFSRKQSIEQHKEICIEYVKFIHNKKIEEKEEEFRELKRKHRIDIDKLKIENRGKIEPYKKQIQDLNRQVEKLQDRLENVAIQAGAKINTVNNNIQQTNNNQRINQIINNMTPITDEYLEEQAQYLTIEHIKNGAEGYAQYAMEYPFKKSILCTDYSRRKLKYKNSDGVVVVDPEMVTLAQKLFTAIEIQNTRMTRSYTDILKTKMFGANTNNDMTEDELELLNTQTDSIIDQMTKLANQRIDVSGMASGLKPDLYHSFVRSICSMAVK